MKLGRLRREKTPASEEQELPFPPSSPTPPPAGAHRTHTPQEEVVVGETVSFEDYAMFQQSEATATDLESLVMLERAIAKGEVRAGTPKAVTYAIAAVIVIIGVVVGIYVLRSAFPGLFPF